jgi:hypothetical protein
MAQDDEVKARMVRALRLASECMIQSEMHLGGYPAGQPDPSLTATAILAVEIFKHLEAPTSHRHSFAPVGT